MAKAIAAQAGDRLSRYLNDIGEYAAPLFSGSRSQLVKRFGPVGLIAAAIGGGAYMLKRRFSRTRPEPAATASAAPKPKKSRKAKSKKQG